MVRGVTLRGIKERRARRGKERYRVMVTLGFKRCKVELIRAKLNKVYKG